MTNKEAIRLIRNLSTMCEFTDAYGKPIDSDAYYEAVDMAISALQAQDSPKPTAESVQNVKDDDLVSRKAAIDAAIKADMENNSNVLSEKRARVIDRHISAVPSAQPLVIHCTDCEDWHERQSLLGFAISKLPSAQPEPQWIPVSKKSHPDTPERVQVQLDNGWIITAYYEENEWLSVPYCDEPIEDRWIEAWMPLPEPYRAERRIDE